MAAARIFGAERTYFVLNGTSASNKMVLGAIVGGRATWYCSTATTTRPRITGRCCWPVAYRSIIPTDRNTYGMVGPLDLAALDENAPA